MKHELEGRTVLLTRTAEDCQAWAAELQALGLQALRYPCLETRTLPQAAEVARAALESCSWVAFSSKRSVDALAALCGTQLPAGVKLACVGPATAERCAAVFGEVRLVPGTRTARGLVDELRVQLGAAESVFLPCAQEGRHDFEELLRPEQLKRVAVYETRLTEIIDTPPPHAAVFFASPSAVEGFAARAGRPPRESLCVAIGTTTAASLEARGWSPIAISKTPDLMGLVQAAGRHWQLERSPSATSPGHISRKLS